MKNTLIGSILVIAAVCVFVVLQPKKDTVSVGAEIPKEQYYKDKLKNSSIDKEIAKGLSKQEKIELKSYTIKDKTKLGKYDFDGKKTIKKTSSLFNTVHAANLYTIEIVSLDVIEGGVQVFARAWKDGNPVGFGVDGTVEIERFRVFNPPVLVDDPNGDIVRAGYNLVEEATTTRRYREDPEEAIKQVIGQNVITVGKDGSNIITGKVGNTTSTFYPDADTETTSVDGWLDSTNSAWDTAHDQVTGRSANPSDIYAYVGFDGRGSTVFIRRTATFFDTSSISSGDTISSATLSYYMLGCGTNSFNGTYDYQTIVQAQGNNWSSDTNMTTADYDLVGDALNNPTEGIDTGDRMDLSSDCTASAYNDFPLNSTGIGWIARSGESSPSGGTAGITYLGFRDAHDTEDINILPTSLDQQTYMATADTTGSTQDPKLVVEHAAGGGGDIPRVHVTPVF